RRVMLGREMTKQYETFYVGPAAEVLSQLADAPKGEFIGLLEAQEISTDQAAAESVL
ncbi:MAG TPA: rRNA (cytidine-2'-O-)-methyltransferase, partial [Gammaproteobacteria bacterium]|nr:rRNA (cytidine-2'-O-)-methyltransferase [Gammaproteobacteria bacterium]